MIPTTLNPILRAEDLFDSLGKEQREPEDRKIEITKNERLEELVKGFEEVLKIKLKPFQPNFNNLIYIIKIIPTSKEISDFSILMSDYQDHKEFRKYSGLYLSALINKSKDKEFIINTNHLEKLPDYMGFENNGKIIRINKDIGDFLGDGMKKGIIYVRNSEGALGYNMKGGEIHADNSGYSLGFSMAKGRIYVKTAGIYIGDSMIGGKIYIENKYDDLSNNIKGGNIYFQGKLIVKDGVKLI
jgi:hypothetical protein